MDLVERSQQVQLMGDIYRLAARVIAWIGPEVDDSSYALETLEFIGESMEVDLYKGTSTPATLHEESDICYGFPQSQHPPLSERQYTAIKSLFFRPWFERLWTQQEIRLADDDAIIACGVNRLSWNAFRKSVFVLQRGYSPRQEPWLKQRNRLYVRRLFEIAKMGKPILAEPILHSIQSILDSKCSDPRDRVYALMSIHEQGRVRGNPKLEIFPNYDAQVSQVYQQTTCEVINTSLEIDVLSSCELGPDNMYNLPCWVPDSSRPRISNSLLAFNATGASTPYWDYSVGSILRVRGMVMCSLLTTEVFFVGESTLPEVLKALRQIRQPMSFDALHMTGGTVLDVYCDAVNCGAFADAWMPPQPFESRESCTEILRMIWDTELDFDGLATAFTAIDMTKHLENLFNYCINRTICTTEQGYVALAPRYAQPEDQVCFLLGSPGSILLRPAGIQWQVVGECYVPGFTTGEALLGPLPQGYRSDCFLDEALNGYASRFQNLSTREVVTEDPRFDISEYPGVGSIIDSLVWNQPDRTWQKGVVRIADGEQADRLAYPWREENLKRRGVLLQDFCLI